MKIILDKKTGIMLLFTLTLMTLLLTTIIMGGIIKQQDRQINAYKQATIDYSTHCDINFEEFVAIERQKLIDQQLMIQNLNNESFKIMEQNT